MRLIGRPATNARESLCPGAVATRIIDNTEEQRPGPRFDPSEKTAANFDRVRAFLQAGTPPDSVGEMVVAGILANQLYIHTDASMEQPVRRRMEALLESFPA